MQCITVQWRFALKAHTHCEPKIGIKRKMTAHEYTDNMIKVVASCYPALWWCPGWEGVAVGGAAGRRTAAPPPVGGDLGAGEGGPGPGPRPGRYRYRDMITMWLQHSSLIHFPRGGSSGNTQYGVQPAAVAQIRKIISSTTQLCEVKQQCFLI